MKGFQERIAAWMDACFLKSLYNNMTERVDRFLEESLELAQSLGYDRNRVQTLVDYVWGRPVGDPPQEVGGVMVTLAGLCHVAGFDMIDEGARELERIEQPWVMEKIKAKQEAKNALHFDTPLPGNADDSLQTQVDRLAAFITAKFPGEPSQSQGAIDTAIRLMGAAPQPFDSREVSTMLAALRFWQLRQTGEAPGNDFDDIADNGGKHEPLTPEEIDALCERINV